VDAFEQACIFSGFCFNVLFSFLGNSRAGFDFSDSEQEELEVGCSEVDVEVPTCARLHCTLSARAKVLGDEQGSVHHLYYRR
jgi:hypothetical protein